MKNKQILIAGAIVIILIAGIIFLAYREQGRPAGELDAFARCIKDSGAKFYGTFWCSHCKSQKEMFGASQKYLPYIECSTPDGQGQNQICKDNKIEGYPTWVFVDGSRQSGEVALEDLATKTGCALP
ncbi:hypothetical protein CO115_00880 [Candidatus Falkowbacteria bacterium CG_4_9_14_3_um_filter_36_9]|uniref:Thioredoxin domain-containing protein n=2 Tax=Candidatus Falkowiibacteriota TaxID=1752728 RepID=A0A1J4T5Z1_9BACT|nr:MAG: hypothetical protein AUJ27_02325 [Candidatus Falkowbacteria bacterium CG1_02_37_44]PIV51179.1 MAG: hypothetical protein COS18_03145 [Candidatus Falkowbacteria bacterium CG02_land_8_20_14_3_00_36_14]PIX11124.1 MAG: hypothetical protein COZ73_03485 [Candidatus Falkowbacteria bacterium CG_4_8_14_3_um_filter_36_11]PJA10668.1 MAG: hypothetical protein COX67_03805 [Candidatus Falkowbacteria bacterium CG_4_10_14_0_2_um_filter_36_22]PJB20661.1 MAG: hypothetical protein CO115_00880 [Candidatus F